MSEGIQDEPLPREPRHDHPAAEGSANTAPPPPAQPQGSPERPVRWTPLANELAQYQGDTTELREIL